MTTDSPEPTATDATRILIDALNLRRLISIVDIGANPIDGTPPYKPLLDMGIGRVTGFEPQVEALGRLVAAQGPNETYLPYAVGDGAEHTLYQCYTSGMTSLLEPDPAALALFNALPRWGEVIKTQLIATRRLDEIEEVDAVDYLKIDVQGSELSVFKGGRGKLRSAVAIHTEVSFVTLYREQPVFGEIDLSLRSLGFLPHAFAAIKRLAIAPTLINNNIYSGLNQLLEADVVYVRDFRDAAQLSDDQLKTLAAIAQCCYGSYDLAIRCLLVLAKRGAVDPGAPAAFVEGLKRSPLIRAIAT